MIEDPVQGLAHSGHVRDVDVEDRPRTSPMARQAVQAEVPREVIEIRIVALPLGLDLVLGGETVAHQDQDRSVQIRCLVQSWK